ncbi:MAG: phosphomannomutase/phosphoglucomutase, partial [Rhodobiaceae bacterium]|nr:phosphomannomutase/phosphoglucomutase [Rhodobiaceae bacterium]
MSFPKPHADLKPNTADFERLPLVKPTGFREYDARWLFGDEINLMGVQAVGLGIAALLDELGVKREIVVAHDYRSYSGSIKMALVSGLMAGGCTVKDLGLAVTPMAYYAQFALDVPAVAMVTASHNDNGWTGIKMGANRPLTFGPAEMGRLKEIVLAADFAMPGGGKLEIVEGFAERYMADLVEGRKLTRPIRVVAACGNGTAAAFAPQVLRQLGAEVIELDCTLDHSFPRYNPNPEDMEMLHALAAAVKEHGAEVGLGFDGDGD